MAGHGREKASGVGITHHPGWERPVHWVRKEGNVYVLDLFVRVLSSVAEPIVYKSQMEESHGGESRSTATAQLFDGRSSERGRQVQAS